MISRIQMWSVFGCVVGFAAWGPAAAVADEDQGAAGRTVSTLTRILQADAPYQVVEALEVDAHRQDYALAWKPHCPVWLVSADYLNWGLHQRGTDFAITTDASTLAIGRGSVQRLEMDRSSGFRANLAYRSASWELIAGYTYFDTSATASAVEPLGGTLWATRSHPNRNEQAGTANAAGSFNYDVFDLEARSPWLRSCPVAVQWFGGLRWTNVDQNFQVMYDGADFDHGEYHQNTALKGFGLRLGAEGHWCWCSRWSLFGKVAGSILRGRFQTQFLETNVSAMDTIVDVRDEYRQGVPVIEAAVGVAWNCGPLEFRGGYEMANWFSLQDRSMFPDNVHEGAFAPSSSDILLEGLFLRLGCSL